MQTQMDQYTSKKPFLRKPSNQSGKGLSSNEPEKTLLQSDHIQQSQQKSINLPITESSSELKYLSPINLLERICVKSEDANQDNMYFIKSDELLNVSMLELPKPTSQLTEEATRPYNFDCS